MSNEQFFPKTDLSPKQSVASVLNSRIFGSAIRKWKRSESISPTTVIQQSPHLNQENLCGKSVGEILKSRKFGPYNRPNELMELNFTEASRIHPESIFCRRFIKKQEMEQKESLDLTELEYDDEFELSEISEKYKKYNSFESKNNFLENGLNDSFNFDSSAKNLNKRSFEMFKNESEKNFSSTQDAEFYDKRYLIDNEEPTNLNKNQFYKLIPEKSLDFEIKDNFENIDSFL